ncbi:MAG: hypothetical protein QW421_05015 [Archaeoglobaceae archaeon]
MAFDYTEVFSEGDIIVGKYKSLVFVIPTEKPVEDKKFVFGKYRGDN